MLSINHDKAKHDIGGGEINESEYKQRFCKIKVQLYEDKKSIYSSKENLEKW